MAKQAAEIAHGSSSCGRPIASEKNGALSLCIAVGNSRDLAESGACMLRLIFNQKGDIGGVKKCVAEQ
jgi:hypothetical protein